MAVNQQEAEKIERKLRPLYDAVDNGQHKKAIQLADKMLKKQEELQCARALKAIALLRMGRQDEAISNMDAVLASHPGDQATLQACTMYFKENSEYAKIAELYADAASHYPKNQEILTHLFMAYVRIGDYQKQQHTAIQLHKAFPQSGPYYCWRVMSILMQATDSKNNDKAKQLFLSLAEKLIDKYFEENEVDSEAEVRLYLMVLDKLNKTEKKLRVLEGPSGEKMKNREDCLGLQVDCLVTLQQWDRAAAKLSDMIHNNPDQWSYIRQYINCQIKQCKTRRRENTKVKMEVGPMENGPESIGIEESGGTCEEGKEGCGEVSTVEKKGISSTPLPPLPTSSGCDADSDSSRVSFSWTDLNGSEDFLQPLHEACDLLESLAAEEVRISAESAEKTRYIVRGPLLGRMELVRQLYFNGMHMIPLNLASLPDMLMDYFKQFGTKGCMFDDLSLYLDVFSKINRDAVLLFLQQVQEIVDSTPIDFNCPDESLKENIKNLARHSNLLQLRLYLNCMTQDTSQLLALCLEYHADGLKLGRYLGSTLSQPSDFYAILAAHILMAQYQQTSEIRVLWEAIFLLERAKNANPQISLLLMKLYGILGANESVTELFKAVSIKHLQMETIGYIPMRYIQSMGTFGFANQLYKSALRFYYGASKDFSEYIIQAYKNGTFTKIEEFVDCRDRLTHSFNFVNTLTEMNILEMILSVNSISQAKEFFKKDWIPKLPCSLRDYVSSLVDNRDLTVLDDWSPPSMRLTDIQVKASFDLECLWLRTRLSLVKSLGEAVSLVSGVSEKGGGQSGKDTEKGGAVQSLEEKVEEYRSTLEQMDQHMGMFHLREAKKQSSQTRLPLQYPPLCLGYYFLQYGHGKILSNMLHVTIKMAESGDQVEDLLKDILAKIEAAKCQISGVPDDLRESLRRSVGSPPPLAPAEGEGTTELGDTVEKSPAELDHPYDILTRSHIDLEGYVMLLQSLSYVLLLCVVCAELFVPSPTGEGKKRKKKKRGTVSDKPTATQAQLRNFVSEVHRMLSSLCQFFHPLPLPDNEEELTLRLKNLYIGNDPERDASSLVSKEKEMKSRVCGTVLTSYDMSLRDTMQLASSKLELASHLIKQLGGEAKLEEPGKP